MRDSFSLEIIKSVALLIDESNAIVMEAGSEILKVEDAIILMQNSGFYGMSLFS